MLLALGAFHGINPGMGWLFAVALGHAGGPPARRAPRAPAARRRTCAGGGGGRCVALAHRRFACRSPLRWPVAGVLVSLGVSRLFRHRHPRWAGMRVGMGGLTFWSFLMATAHGAGLMVVPVFMGMAMPAAGDAHYMHAAGERMGAAFLPPRCMPPGIWRLRRSSHCWSSRSSASALRRSWLNLDLVWSAALVATGALTLML